ncbi:MAG: dioxygenase extradiol [Bacteroidota bacterium]|jgi:4,5-DOPA dioxygenase extradiol
MQRKDFLKALAALPIAGAVLHLPQLAAATNELTSTDRMPALFLGHGSPMNAIEENEFVKGFRTIAQKIETKPQAILCISAHWETAGTKVTAMDMPKTIHDFGGFPKALHEVQYPAPGSKALVDAAVASVSTTTVEKDYAWGLDHGAWSVIKHMYPNADVPVVQMSIDYTKDAQYHYELAKQLQALRQKGVLIVGSGNMVHNLGMVAWDKIQEDNYAFDWNTEAITKMSSCITNANHADLINYKSMGKAFDLAIPSPEHYLPLLYILALQNKSEQATIFNNKAVAGSLSMASVHIA